jgi:hypothetical protein
MEHSPPLEATRFAASQEIPHILWNPKVYYSIQSACYLLIPEPVQSSPYPRISLLEDPS